MVESAAKSALFVPVEAGSRYDVGPILAAGGMGTVYSAFDRLAQRPVAYKRMRVTNESARPRLAAFFQREYDTLTRLTHPNIVEAYDFGFDAYGSYYVMELLSGEHLAKLAPLPFREACRVLRDVASALALLHARRLVHRDVSPKNVCLTTDGRAKLLDFGALTPFGTPAEIVGTPAFIAPECLIDAPLDQRTDLYSLGALAYWALTRHTHLHARSIDDLPDAWQEPILPPSRFVSELPQALDELVLSLLQQRPQARPASAAHVIERLTTIAELAPEQDAQRVAYSYLRRPPLLGREHALSELGHALKDALAGAGRIVLIEGEQGLGRSALLDHVAVDAQVAGATVLRAGAGLHTAPFSAAHHLVHSGLATFPSVAQRMRERSSQFIRLLGTHDGKGALVRSAIDASERQAAIASLLSDSLQELSACGPLVLLIDDAHGLDAESLALFASMTEMIRERPILLVLGARAGHVARDPQARAKLEGNADRLKLAPLSEAQLNQLVSTMFGGVPNCQSVAAWLYAQAGGNPAHSMDLARLLLARGAVRYTLGTFTLPYEFAPGLTGAGHSDALLASLAGVSAEARALATLLAAHKGPLGAGELASAHGVSTGEAMRALEELVQRGALVARGESLCCASEALRSALLGTLTPEQVRAGHGALARALTLHGPNALDSMLARAEHLLQADEAEQLEGAYLLARAAERHKFELGMKFSALPLLASALNILERRGHSDEECIGLLVPLCMAGFYGDISALRRYLDRALGALASICGLTLARRLRPWLGSKVALTLGLLGAFVLHVFRRRGPMRHSFVEYLETLTAVTGPATAAAACSFDAQEAWRVVAWLEPLAAAPPRSPLFFMREFCVATAELVSARFRSASERYASLLSMYERATFGIDAKHAVQIRSGCLNGYAQALVTDTAPASLTLAEELERVGGAFFAPQCEGIRATYHATRGEAQRAAEHRRRAEALSLRAGTSWSALSVLIVRSVLPHVLSGDVIALVRVLPELEQLAKLSGSLEAFYELAQAHLEHMRGQSERALERYERVFARDVARRLPSYPAERALHARALSGVGDHAGARALCLALLEELAHDEQESDILFCIPRVVLATAEAQLGNSARAIELLDHCFARDDAHGNPLLLGTLHRERAHVAALAGDRAAFAHHFAAMNAHFRATENPCLVQQCEALSAQAIQLGACEPAPSHEQGTLDALDGQTVIERPDGQSSRVQLAHGLDDAG